MPRPSAGLSRRAKIVLGVSLVVLLTASWHRLYLAPLPGPQFEFSGETMGTTFLVKIAAPEMTREDYARVAASVSQRLTSVNARMSTWDADSELSRFNLHGAEVPFSVSRETIDVFLAAREVSEQTGGAFDVTVAPLVAAWGFGAGAKVPGGPKPEELAALRSRVGFERVRVETGSRSLVKDRAEVVCDLSAIAKGYAVDQLAADVAALGWENHLVEIGGELRAAGVRPAGGAWRVAVEAPAATAGAGRRAREIVALSNLGMATSGDYRNFYEQGGSRISHTIDPRTGRPIRHPLASVTVLHPEAMYADAYATALNVLGPEEGLALARELDLAAYFIIRARDGTFSTLETGGFTAARAEARD